MGSAPISYALKANVRLSVPSLFRADGRIREAKGRSYSFAVEDTL